jgi:hypothetical protein
MTVVAALIQAIAQPHTAARPTRSLHGSTNGKEEHGPPSSVARSMFFLFSNRLGCFGSLLLSAVVTIALLFLLGIVRF